MNIENLKNTLLQQRKSKTPGSIYYKTQIDFAYNTNHIEGSTITSDETISIYETGTIFSNDNKVFVLKDLTETQNHFTLFNYMLDTLNNYLSEQMIKQFHLLLKTATLQDDELSWVKIGDYKTKKNIVGNTITSLPKDVPTDMQNLLNNYSKIENKTIHDIIDFHFQFEQIHPFQDGNGRVGRMIMFRECLINNIMPFYIEDRNKAYYLRGLQEYKNNNKECLTDTCLHSQDNYNTICTYFLEN